MFRCALTEFDTLAISITTTGSSHVSQLPIGYDDVSGCRYSAMVAMDSVIGYSDDTKELIFCILEYDRGTDDVRQMWDGLETRKIIVDAEHLRAVMSAILQMVHALVDDVSPTVVTMNTHMADLPKKALTKYNMIATTIAKAGYKAGKSDVWHGRHTWMMERR